MANPPGNCIFCAKGDLSKEHVYPNWLRRYVPRTMESHTTLSAVFHPTHVDSRVTTRPGDPRARRLRVVCRPCNTGWMSRLQEKAKPILLPLIEGKPTLLSLQEQTVVAAWAAMFCMTAEFHDKSKVAISAEERTWLMEKRTAPLNWDVWIGNYRRGDWVGHWVHNIVPVIEKGQEGTEESLAQPNTQTTTFVVGQLYVHTFSSTNLKAAHMIGLKDHIRAKVFPVWPPEEPVIVWPPSVMTDREADLLAEAFFNIAKRTGLRRFAK